MSAHTHIETTGYRTCVCVCMFVCLHMCAAAFWERASVTREWVSYTCRVSGNVCTCEIYRHKFIVLYFVLVVVVAVASRCPAALWLLLWSCFWIVTFISTSYSASSGTSLLLTFAARILCICTFILRCRLCLNFN